MNTLVQIQVLSDTAELWGVPPTAIDKAFMEKVRIHSELYEGLKPENAADLQKGFDGKSLIFTFHDGRKVKVFDFATK